MRKKKLIMYIVAMLCLLTACGEKTDNIDNDNQMESNSTEGKEVRIAENYTGVGGYITDNMVYDYSEMFDKVYDWGNGMKMPFQKPEDAEIGWQEVDPLLWNSMYIADITEEEMEAYINLLEEDGFSAYKVPVGYWLYKDNLRVSFSYEDNHDRYVIFCYAGNVMSEREVTRKDARKLINENKLLEGNDYFKDYYVFAIENETVAQAGYYEFVIESMKGEPAPYEERAPFYLITDGKDVMLFEQCGVSMITPSNANIVNKDGKTELVVATMIIDQTYNSYVGGYVLEDNKFVKGWEYDWRYHMDMDPNKNSVISMVEDDEIKFYLVKTVENYDHKKGRKDFWVIDKEYEIVKTKVE